MVKKPVKKTEKRKHEEEHVGPTLDRGSRLKISIKEFSWEREDDGSTLETEDPEQQEIVYIMNLENGFQKNSTKMYNDIAPESEQRGKSESMLDLDSTRVSEECAIVLRTISLAW